MGPVQNWTGRVVALLFLTTWSRATAFEADCKYTADPSFTAALFPEDFYFGMGISAIQAEGALQQYGQGATVWEESVAVPGFVKDGSDPSISADCYHHYQEDIESLKSIGATAYRVSISWPRLFPNGRGAVNKKGLEYYHRFIDAIVDAGIKPVVTLYHLDLPAYLHHTMGGWLNETIKDYFVEFADHVFQEFGDKVTTWLTFNEPNMFVKQGYATGQFAPQVCTNRTKCAFGNSSIDAYVAAHNVLRSHAAVVDLYKTKYQKEQGGEIGLSLLMIYYYPLAEVESDYQAAERATLFSFGWFADPLFKGDYPPVMRELVGERLPTFTTEERNLLLRSMDFLGINIYTANFATKGQKPPSLLSNVVTDAEVIVSTKDKEGNLIGPATPTTFIFVVPHAMYATLMWAYKRYGDVPMIIVENGVADAGNASIPMEQTLCDQPRIDFLILYLRQILRAVRAGVTVRGYLGWSLMDNWEWTWGYTLRYGMNYVDFNDPKRQRHPKLSSKWWTKFLAKDSSASFTDESRAFPRGESSVLVKPSAFVTPF